jgi:GntR family transcriptional regulator/MocR family aminotransferase
MHLVHELRVSQPDAPLAAQAGEAGVILAPLSAYAMESRRRGWLFGYAGYDAAALRAAARVLGPLLRRLG